ncbi:unnamed protein product [Didymodactylos carnosus]|uniref:RING-type domain-containing protein n=1 Tax=Didymodactylos carnosus TaxID=1234261 RepID=A0A815BSL0_9BILA|nr:unnamed protein product [Didymodactylos carnosus]CAF4067105.1 unnamed protein product [Didymodactylos carnosus]
MTDRTGLVFPDRLQLCFEKPVQRIQLQSTVELGYLDSSRVINDSQPNNHRGRKPDPQEYYRKSFTTTTTNVDQEYLCTICHNILWKPVSCSSCENSFCSSCIQTWLTKQQNPVKLCPFKCEYKQKRVPPILNTFLSKLIFSCAFAQNGCQEQLNYDSIENHEQQCVYEQQQCPLCQQFYSNRYSKIQPPHDLKQCFAQIPHDGSIAQTMCVKLLEVIQEQDKRIKILEDKITMM